MKISEEVAAMKAHFAAEEAATCPNCLGYGFRVGVGPGRTINAKSAIDLGYMQGTSRILCGCQLVKSEAELGVKIPSFQATPAPKRVRGGTKKHVVQVAGRKAQAYVDTAEV